MAIMIPKKPIKTNSDAEVTVFKVFEEKLSDEWMVVHSYRFKQDTDDGEIDFVLIHKEIGAIVVEVKGGGVHVKEREWYTINRNREHIKIQNPYTQVNRNKIRLYKELKGDLVRIYTSQIVFLPDVYYKNLETSNEEFKKLTLYKEDISSTKLEDKLKKIVNRQIEKYTSTNNITLSDETMDNIKKYFNYKFNAEYSEKDFYIETKENFMRLSKEQRKRAQVLIDNKRVSINAPAGTGKTVVGVYRAVHGLNNNEKILYICHNENSKDRIIEYIKCLKNVVNKENIDICTFKEFEENEYSRLKSIGRWNCIIIDDAQELTEEDILSIRALNSEYMHILYDTHQCLKQVSCDNLKYLELECKFSLHENIRNTNQITDLCYKLINKDPEEYKSGVEGVEPNILFIKNINDNLPDELEDYIHRLNKKNIYKLSEILILTTESINDSSIYCEMAKGFNNGLDMEYITPSSRCIFNNNVYYRYKTCKQCSSKFTKTIYESIGIEKPYVILVDEHDCIKSNVLQSNKAKTNLIKYSLYTAISRATYKVKIILKYENDEECGKLSHILG
ncbi:MAG: NERD domain-containing protein, partial [Paraclostridium dentum]|uniref:nuclease-related domain-containing DEAD/DEAH box helicase n=1 Tax=Paraclostridium dentum TaxID=2662455 RepID=UPI003EE68B10